MKRIYLVILIAFIASSLIACSIKPSNQLPTKSVSSERTPSSQNQTSSTGSSSEITSSRTEEIEYEVPLPPVSKELQELYLKGLEAYCWFSLNKLSFEGELIKKGDSYYGKVIDPRFPSYEIFNNYIFSIFTKNLINKKLMKYKPYICIDKKLYVVDADRGSNIDYVSHEFKLASQTDSKIKLTAIAHYDDQEKKYTEEFPIVFQKIEGKWLISDFNYWQ